MTAPGEPVSFGSRLYSGPWVDFATAVAFLSAIALAAIFQLSNFDIWWHLRTGELIPERGIPTRDWYALSSDTPEAPAWIDVHWGFQLVVAGRNRVAERRVAHVGIGQVGEKFLGPTARPHEQAGHLRNPLDHRDALAQY